MFGVELTNLSLSKTTQTSFVSFGNLEGILRQAMVEYFSCFYIEIINFFLKNKRMKESLPSNWDKKREVRLNFVEFQYTFQEFQW